MKSSCLTPADLDAQLNGTLTPSSSAVVEAHLQECAACCQRLDAGAGNLHPRFALPPTPSAESAGPVDEIIRRLKADHCSDTEVVAIAFAPTREPPPNRLGDYEIVDELGRGGMGIVYRARQVSLQREVALKVISGAHLSIAHVQRFHVEAEAAGRLDHPHIVPIFEIGEDGDALFLVMEYIVGATLHHRLLEGR